MSIENIQENISKALDEMKSVDIKRTVSYKDLFETKSITLRIICSFVIWTSGGVCYFGINQFITYLGTNIYMAVALLGFIQVSNYIMFSVSFSTSFNVIDKCFKPSLKVSKTT